MTNITSLTACESRHLQTLLDFFNGKSHSRRLIARYCHGELPLPSANMLQYIQQHNDKLITSDINIKNLFDEAIQTSSEFYSLLEKAISSPRAQYRNFFETRVQSYGQMLIDQMYHTRQHIRSIRIKNPNLLLSTPEAPPADLHIRNSLIWKIKFGQKIFSRLGLWIFRNHHKILALYYTTMIITMCISWGISFTALETFGYRSNLAFFASTIISIITMLTFLAFHPVVDFSNYDISGKNLLANTYRKHMQLLKRSRVEATQAA